MIDSAEIAALVGREYPLGAPTGCVPLSEGMNEVHRVDGPDGRYVLRVHGLGKWWLRNEGDLQFELELLTHLRQHELPVSSPVPRISGELLGVFQTSGDDRYYSLFTWAPGEPVGRRLIGDQVHRVGQLIARIHLSADLFSTELPRYELGEDTLLDRPLRVMDAALRRADAGLATYVRIEIEKVRERLRAFDPGPDGWGIVHGDLQDLNYHLSAENKITLFDFDLCGYGWRGYDLAYYVTRLPEPLRQAALDGYGSVRPISDAERAMIPTFGRAAWIKECTMVGSGLAPPDLARNLEDPYLP